jgi:excisionase family DNA binding protein
VVALIFIRLQLPIKFPDESFLKTGDCILKGFSVDIERPIAYRINVATAKLGMSRTTIYRMVHDGKLTLVKIGVRSSGITTSSLNAIVGENMQQ